MPITAFHHIASHRRIIKQSAVIDDARGYLGGWQL
jgi:hypothetical protein